MYALKPTALYMLHDVNDCPDGLARVSRIVSALGRSMDDVETVTADNIYDVARSLQSWTASDSADGVPMQHQRPLVFAKIVIEAPAEHAAILAKRPEDIGEDVLKNLLGYISLVRDTHSPESDAEKNMVCWNTQDFGVMHGCPHGCQYCGFGRAGKFITVGVNIDEYMQKVVRPTIEKHPGQRCFRMIGWSADIITFEPEYGVFEAFLKTLADYDDHYGYFHTASDNVDWIADLPHRDRLIGIWSLSPESMARELEPGSPSAVDRVIAAAKLAEWGVPARFKFKPMIPVRNWRQEYADLIEEIYKRTKPETIGFCVLMWMNFVDMKERMNLDVFDPEIVTVARRAAAEMRDVRTGPFPHHIRADIYRVLIGEVRKWDKDIPVFLSTESREMWDALKDDLGQNPRTFLCGCNPIQAAGPKMLPCDALKHSTYIEPQKKLTFA